jgi:hypothetical protein
LTLFFTSHYQNKSTQQGNCIAALKKPFTAGFGSNYMSSRNANFFSLPSLVIQAQKIGFHFDNKRGILSIS